MFVIDDALIWGPLIGAAAGGLLNRRDPIKGALLGAGLGLGATAMPGLLGAAATPSGAATAAGATAAAETAGAAAAAAPTMAPVADAVIKPVATAATTTPWQDALLIGKNALETVKPVGQAMQAAQTVNGLLGGEKTPLPPIPPSPVAVGQGGPQALSTLVTNNANLAAQMQQDAAQRARRRMELIYGG